MAVFRPHTIQGRAIIKPSKQVGMGALLLDNGKGHGSTYQSVQDYLATTNRPQKMDLGPQYEKGNGMGLGAGRFKDKLDSLLVKSHPRKPKNIKFNM